MLKTSRTPPPDAAIDLGIRALEFLASEPELLSRFLALSGLEAGALRAAAAQPAFFAGLLDFILEHEPTLESFSAFAGVPPHTVAEARDTLSQAFGATPR